MNASVCDKCGAENEANARFCRKCGNFLGWDIISPTNLVDARGGTPVPVQPTQHEPMKPVLDRREWAAVIDRGAAAQIDMRVHNTSAIVDEYTVKMIEQPPWLTIAQTDAKVMPGESQLITVTFAIRPGTRVRAHTFTGGIEVHSSRDDRLFDKGEVSLTVAGFDPMPSITAHPNIVRVEGGTEGRFEIRLDNRSSNIERYIQLAGSDPDEVVRFRLSPPRLTVPAGGTAEVDVGFRLPELTDEANRTWELTISASDTHNATERPSEVTVTVIQEWATPPPVRLRLDPGVLRVENRLKADVEVIVDNRDGKRDRRVNLRGDDPENAVRFGFQRRDVQVPAGQAIRVRLSVSADPPPAGQKVSRPYSVIAAEGDREVSEAMGTLIQASVPVPEQPTQQPMKPVLDRREWAAVIERGAAAQIDMRVHNTSAIVDEYTVKMIEQPPWLTIAQTDAKVMPGESQLITVTFAIRPGTRVRAHTFTGGIEVHSSRDDRLFDKGEVSLTVAGFGPMPSITAHPNIVRVEGGTEGRFEIRLDNRSSNIERYIQLAGSDPDEVVRFRLSPPRLTVPAGGTAEVDVGFRLPELTDEANRTWELTISASDTHNATERPSEVTVTVIQEWATTPPVRLQLDPGVLRVRDRLSGDIEVTVDNRDGKRDRRVNLRGDDPENAVRFAFQRRDVQVPAGQAIRVQLSVSADPPPAGQEVSRPFSVLAAEDRQEVGEAKGTLIQATSESPVKKAKLRLKPETLKVRNTTTGLYRIVIENKDDAKLLQVVMEGSDRENVVRFAFSPDRFRISPGGETWGWVRVWAPRPGRRRQLTREISVEASDGNDSALATGTFVQSRSGWIRALLDFLAGTSRS